MASQRATAGSPELAKLAETYDIESELHRSDSTVTYVARQKDGGRPVTLTVIDAASPAERNALTHLAADARLLASARHPHVVPVLETRWLAANRLAVARVRVRGTTLRQALESVGPMPESRAVEVLKEVADVLGWAASSGIVHRQLSSDSVCFQKGSAKVMVSFGLPAVFGKSAPQRTTTVLPDRCADAATLAQLAYEMLTAHQASDASIDNLLAVRQDLSPRVVDAIAAGLECRSGAASLDPRRFVTLLTGSPPVIGAGAIATAASAPVVPRDATSPVPPPVLPLGGPTVGNPHRSTSAPPVAPPPRPASAGPVGSPAPADPPPPIPPVGPAPRQRRRGRGRGLLIASMLGLLILIGGTFYLISQDRDRDETRIATNRSAADRGGDVDVEPLPPNPGGLTVGGAPAGPVPDTTALPPAATAPVPPVEELPIPSLPQPGATTPSVPTRPEPRNACESPTPTDQRACLNQRLATRDAELNSVYQALVQAVGARQGAQAVESLREEQRAWLAERDRRCEGAGTGALWAAERADCLGRVSDERALGLARELARVRSAP